MRRVVIVALFAGLALAVFLGLRTTGVATPAAELPVDADATATTRLATGAASTDIAPEPVRQSVEPTPAPPLPAGASVAVAVVRGATGTPLPGAEVWYLERNSDVIDTEQRAMRLLHRAAFDVVLHKYGASVVADTQGRVRLPMPPLDLSIACAHDGLYGQLVINSAEARRRPDGWKLELTNDCSVMVEVVDFGGRPVGGVPLALYVPRREPSSATTRIIPMELGTTDADGRYPLTHVQRYRSYWGTQSPDAPREVVLAVHVPGIRDVFERIVCEDPPAGPVRLRIPPTGRLRVEARDAQDRPVLHGISVQVTTQAVPDMSVADGMIGLWGWRQQSDDASVVFEHVAVGAELTVHSSVQARWLERTVAGPPAAGSEVVCRLRLQGEGAMLNGRAVDETGAHLINRGMLLCLLRDGRRHLARVHTDADGILRLGIPIDLFNAPGRLSLRGTLDRDDEFRMTARLDIEGLTEGERDLGEVVFAPGPLLVTGRFLGEAELARVQLRAERILSRDGPVPLTNSDTLKVRRTGAEFAVYGHIDGGPARLVVTSDEHLPVEPIEFKAGARDVEIRLQRGGWVDAVIVHGDAVSASQLLVRLVPQGAPPEPRVSWASPYVGRDRASGDGRTRFSWQGLRDGPYDFSVCTALGQQPVFEAPNVLVQAAAAVDDKRIAEIDLRDRLHVFAIRAVTPGGETIVDQWGSVFRLRADGSLDPGSRTPVNAGRATVLSGEPVLDLSIFLSGYRTARLDGVNGDRVVTMVPGIPLRVTVSPGAIQLPAGAKSLLVLEPVDPRVRDCTSSMTAELSNGVGAMRAQVAGRYKARVRVTAPALDRVYVTEPTEIEVRDIPGEQVFRFVLE